MKTRVRQIRTVELPIYIPPGYVPPVTYAELLAREVEAGRLDEYEAQCSLLRSKGKSDIRLLEVTETCNAVKMNDPNWTRQKGNEWAFARNGKEKLKRLNAHIANKARNNNKVYLPTTNL